MNILVSSCLLGLNCRYCGTGCGCEQVTRLSEKHHLIPVCPEQMGGMPTPRAPVEIVNGKAIDNTGKDVTAQFKKGAEEAAKLAELFHCTCAVLKSRSPSCGCGIIYDGSFSGNLVSGNGFTAQKLLDEGIQVVNENTLNEIKADEFKK